VELNLPAIHSAIAAAVPDRECIVHGDRRLSWAEVDARSARFAGALVARGIGRLPGELSEAEPWESLHDHVALYLHNGVEYLEAMLGTMKARAAAVNVNYRYVAEELRSLLVGARPRVVIHHEAFTPVLAEVLPSLPSVELVVRVPDGSGHAPIAGAVDYEELVADAPGLPDEVRRSWSGDDLYLLYTGGTTGAPKGVCWRQADFLVAALGVTDRDGSEYSSLDPLVERARGGSLRALPAPPFMHGAAHWNAISAWIAGGTVVIQERTTHLDPADVLDTCEREHVGSLLIVGDAFARPLVDELRNRPRDLSSLRFVMTGGAALGPGLADALVELVPSATILDVLGSSESGRHGTRRGAGEGAGRFERSATTVVLDDARSRVLEPGSPEVGWLAQRGRVPRGYLDAPDATAATFPVVDGTRCSVPGDRARLLADGTIELHGRESVTINSGGEKIFAEEVEAAVKRHPDVIDAVVVGRPSARWGQEVVAVVALRAGTHVSDEELVATCEPHLARYKLPKAVVRRDEIERSPAGKPDYRWARAQAEAG
jgi:3-oxocholest-4-en-26-oate---CoA ligase